MDQIDSATQLEKAFHYSNHRKFVNNLRLGLEADLKVRASKTIFRYINSTETFDYTFMGFKVYVDDKMNKNEYEFRDSKGKILIKGIL